MDVLLLITTKPVNNNDYTEDCRAQTESTAVTEASPLMDTRWPRQRYFNVSSLHELFDTVNAQNILGFIRDIGLYRLL